MKKWYLTLVCVLLVMLLLPAEAKAAWKKSPAGYYRYYNSSGTLAKNRWIGNYYVDNRGIRLTNQWLQKEKKKVFVGADGRIIPRFKGGWVEISNAWYYYTKKGEQKKGWLELKKHTYYLNPKTGARVSGWKTVRKKKYYFYQKSGAMAVNRWIGSSYVGKKGSITKTVPVKASLKMNPLYQNPELPTGCESVALTIALRYLGFPLSKTEIVDSYLTYSQDNFVTSFWGDPRSGDGGGCFAPAIVNAADRYLKAQKSRLRAVDMTGASFESLYRYVYEKKPVVIWGTMYMQEPIFTGITNSYEGKTYYWYQLEHCMVLCGYDQTRNTVTINDPLSGMVTRNADEFERLYNKMGKMAVVIQ